MFLYTVNESEPCLKPSLTVFDSLKLSACYQGVPVKRLREGVVPDTVNDARSLFKVLDSLFMLSCEEENCHLVDAISVLLDKLEGSIHAEKKETVKFLKEQLLTLAKGRVQYSSQLMVLSCILYTISAHAYKFLRKVSGLTLPHPSTIRNVCSSYQLAPQAESSGSSFLQYVAHRFKQLQPHETCVTLMLDEIHIKPFLDYKGGSICGAAANSSDAATSAHVFMIQSLLTSFREVAYILPVKTLTGDDLHMILKKVILRLEEIGFKVVAVVCDNNSLNRKAMMMFSEPRKLRILYPHPADPSRPLFYVVDAVHLLKCIRNNWINQKMQAPTSSTHTLTSLTTAYTQTALGVPHSRICERYTD